MADQIDSRHGDPRIDAALADYLERTDRGETVPVEAFLSQHAEIAAELRSLLLVSDDLARLGPSRGIPVTAPPEASTRSAADQNIETIAPQRVQSPAAAETLLQRLPDTFGRYRIIRLLGSGAMGDVYLAEDSQLQRQVAIKTPGFDADETGELLERFYREARSAAVLRHPNICPVFDVGEINGRHYISMAYIAGQPLSAYIRPGKPQPERQALAVIRKLALALQEAHDHGIIHRDLKPGNVMVDRKGEPIVMDFGLARATQSEAGARLTQSGMIVGSPAYMSPEQVEGDASKLTPATDQYSLGVILYELLTGGLPFRGGVTAVIGAILTKAPMPPGQLRADLDPRIEALCLKMMSKSPGERFPSMRAVAEAIAGILKSDPVRPTAKTPPGPSAAAAPQAAPSPAAASITASNVESLLDAANKCMRKHDYEQVVQLLDAIPERKRTEQIRALLAKARELSDEVAFLIVEIDEALRLNDNDALARKTDALLKLKPRHRKALQIKDELGRYGKGRIWKAGGWTPDGRRIGEGSWIPWLPLSIFAGVFGVSLLLVVLYLRVGDAIVRVRITHPDVEVGIQDRTLNIRSANQDIKVDPGEDTLTISFQGAEFETDKFTLKNGDNPAIVVELLDKTLSARFGDLSIGEWPVDPQTPETPDPETPAVAGTSPVQPASPEPAPQAATIPAAVASPVPADALVFQGHSYKYFGERLSWKEAQQRCEALGGHLPIVETAAENAFLDQLVHRGFPAAGRRNQEAVWLGATDEVVEGEWRWTDGTRVAYTNWLKTPNNGPGTQPNNKEGREHYALLWISTDPNRASGQWSDQPNVSEQHVAHFICEWDEVRSAATVPDAAGWTDLFNGRDLTGWKAVESNGAWSVRNGALTCTPGLGWLATEQEFSDFELSLEFRMQQGDNSGVFLRIPDSSGNPFGGDFLEVQLRDDVAAGLPVYERTGSIYAVAGPAQSAQAPPGSWHTLHIKAIGPEITVTVNGREVSRVNLDTSPVQGKPHKDIRRTSGHIGLQRHKKATGVEFRNIRIRELPSPSAAAAEWTDLFNGRDLAGWRGLRDPWRWEQGELVGSTAGAAGFNTVLGSEASYRDFEIEFDVQLEGDRANSGLQIRSRISDPDKFTAAGPQVDLGGEFWGSLYDEGSGDMLQTADKATVGRSLRPNGYNRIHVQCIGKHVRVELNGALVLDGDFPGIPDEGVLGWQLHRGQPMTARFRNVRIRQLTAP